VFTSPKQLLKQQKLVERQASLRVHLSLHLLDLKVFYEFPSKLDMLSKPKTTRRNQIRPHDFKDQIE
jgi:hypothetical protein